MLAQYARDHDRYYDRDLHYRVQNMQERILTVRRPQVWSEMRVGINMKMAEERTERLTYRQRREQKKQAKNDAHSGQKKARTQGAAHPNNEAVILAMEALELKAGFTMSELKKRRTAMLQKVHPDQGGSAMMTRLVNESYEILKPLAKS